VGGPHRKFRKRSKIETAIPKPVREQVDRLLVEGETYADVAGWLKGQGHDVSRSAIGRYGVRLEKKLASIRASTEAARIIAEAAPDDSDQRSAAVISLVQSDLFEAMLDMQDSGDMEAADRVKVLSQAARAIAEASRASVAQKKWSEEIGRRLDALEASEAKGAGRLDPETLRAVREALYGG